MEKEEEQGGILVRCPVRSLSLSPQLELLAAL
jgi:hypothetical protein